MTPTPAPDAPNVLVFLTDQQRWDSTGLHGNPLGLTPTLDALAARGVAVDHSYTNQPVCAPSRASLQTGQYPTTTGVFRNGIPLPADAATLAHDFRAAGYHTGYIGKWHLAEDDCAGPVPEERRGGYEHWLAANLLEFTSDAYETTLYDGDGRPHTYGGYRADALGDAAAGFLTRDRDRARPFFLFLSLLEPHHQNSRDDYPAPEGYRERYTGADGTGASWTPPDLAALDGNWPRQLAGYHGMVRRVDEVLERVLGALEADGTLENTVVLFTSDHGCHFRTRNDEYKRSLHDASLRVPTVLCGPCLPAGVRLPHLVGHVDLPPTLLEAAGLPVPERMQGRSLLGPLRGETGRAEAQAESRPSDVLVQISESEVGRALRGRRWKYGAVAPDADPWHDARADRYVDAYLYDLAADPHELTNLVAGRGEGTDPAYAGTLRELRARLADRIEASGEPRPRIEPADRKARTDPPTGAVRRP